MKKRDRLFFCTIVSILFFLQGCAMLSDNGNLGATQDLTKKLLDREARRTIVDLLGVTYDPNESKLITTKKVHEWMLNNRYDLKKFPIETQKAINNKSLVALLIPKFIPVKNKKPSIKSYDIGGLYLALFLDDIGGLFLEGIGDGCIVRCEKCTGCTGPNNMCECYFTCCKECGREECWPCLSCAENP